MDLMCGLSLLDLFGSLFMLRNACIQLHVSGSSSTFDASANDHDINDSL
jgi:hypothetical protein